MVARLQDLRNPPAAEFWRTGVVWMLEQPGGMRVCHGALRVAEHSGQRASDRVDNEQSGQFAAGDDIVAEGDLVGDQMLAHTLVDSFVAIRDQRHVLVAAKLLGHLLAKHAPLRRKHNDRNSRRGTEHALDRVEHGLGFHHHSAATTVWRVVGHLVLVGGVITNIVDAHIQQTSLARSPQDACLEVAWKHLWKKSKYVKAHRCHSNSGLFGGHARFHYNRPMNKQALWDLASRTWPIAILVVMAFATLVPVAPHLQEFPSTDSSVFLYVADGILNGEVPYKDVWDHKAPMIYYIDALGLATSGGSRWGVWLLELIFVATAVVLGYSVLKRAFGIWPALLASTLFLVELMQVLDLGNLTEEYALLFQWLALLLFWQSVQKPSVRTFLAIGAVLALGFLLKPNSLGIPLAIGGFLLYQTVYKKSSETARWIAFALVGGASVLASVGVYFFLVGGLADLWDAVFVFNSTYAGKEAAQIWTSLSAGLTSIPIASLLGLFGWVIALYWQRNNKKKPTQLRDFVWVLLLALPLEIVFTIITGRDYSHYYIVWLPALVALAAFVPYFVQSFSTKTPKLAEVVSLGLLLGFAPLPILSVLPKAASLAGSLTSLQLPAAEVDDHRYTPVLDYVYANIPADRPLLVWGNQLTINWITGRRAPTRYIYQTPLLLEGYTSRERVYEVIADLEANPPVVIDTGPGDGFMPDLQVRLDRLPMEIRPLYRYFKEHYVYAGTFESTGWDLYLYHGDGIPLPPEDQ